MIKRIEFKISSNQSQQEDSLVFKSMDVGDPVEKTREVSKIAHIVDFIYSTIIDELETKR